MALRPWIAPELAGPRRALGAGVLAGLWLGAGGPGALEPRALAAQGGYTQEEYPELGLSFPRPRDYEELPLPPDEPFRVLDFAAKPPKARTNDEELERLLEGVTRLFVVAIDWFPDPETAPSDRTRGLGGPEEESAEEEELPITTLERYLAHFLPDWSLGAASEGPRKAGWESSVHPLHLRTNTGLAGLAGQAWVFRTPQQTIAFLGFCAEDQLSKQEKIWRSIASKVEIRAPEVPDLSKLQRLYERSSFRRPEYRIGVRSALVRGWEATDLEDYIVVSHTKDEKLLRRIYRDLQAIRGEYERLFPPTADIDAVSTVRICRDRTEYRRYGGPPGSAGYWNPKSEELVLYDAVIQERGERPKDDDTFVILYHEAFHQYIHYSAGELAPHDWFNEGYGDYFSGAVMKGGQVLRIDPSPWRLPIVRLLAQIGAFVRWSSFLELDHEAFYDPEPFARARNYAQAWSMVYFLQDPKTVKRHPQWAGILPLYFSTLQSAWREETSGVDPEDETARHEAESRARARALREAFAGHDVREIEADWRAWVATL